MKIYSSRILFSKEHAVEQAFLFLLLRTISGCLKEGPRSFVTQQRKHLPWQKWRGRGGNGGGSAFIGSCLALLSSFWSLGLEEAASPDNIETIKSNCTTWRLWFLPFKEGKMQWLIKQEGNVKLVRFPRLTIYCSLFLYFIFHFSKCKLRNKADHSTEWLCSGFPLGMTVLHFSAHSEKKYHKNSFLFPIVT